MAILHENNFFAILELKNIPRPKTPHGNKKYKLTVKDRLLGHIYNTSKNGPF